MRLIKLALLPLFFLSMSQAVLAEDCSDFTGNYAWSDEDGNYIGVVVSQVGCSSVVMDYNAFGFEYQDTHIFNGERRLIQDDGDFQAYETATFDSTHISILEERRGVDDEDGTPYVYFIVKDIFLNGDGNLVEISENLREDGTKTNRMKTTFTRIQD